MAIGYLMDQHIPGPITKGLRIREVDVLTAFEDGSHQLPDDELLQRAGELNRVLVTQDDDLLVIATQWLEEDREFNGIVYSHQLNITIGKAVEDLELLARCCDEDDFVNHVEYIPLH